MVDPKFAWIEGPSEEPGSLYFITSFSGIYSDQARLRHSRPENLNKEENSRGKTQESSRLLTYIYMDTIDLFLLTN